MTTIVAIGTPTLGDRSYLAHDGRVAIVVDPQRDIDRVLAQLLARVAEVPSGEVWVHGAGGYRASVAASVLAAHGRHVVAVDDSHDEHAVVAGLPVRAAA